MARLDGPDPEYGDGPIYSEVCLNCAHFHDLAFMVEAVRKCDAFEAIPEVIWKGENLHRQPFEGDGGITYLARIVAGS